MKSFAEKEKHLSALILSNYFCAKWI